MPGVGAIVTPRIQSSPLTRFAAQYIVSAHESSRLVAKRGSHDLSDLTTTTLRRRETLRFAGFLWKAAEGARTLDLLHGKLENEPMFAELAEKAYR